MAAANRYDGSKQGSRPRCRGCDRSSWRERIHPLSDGRAIPTLRRQSCNGTLTTVAFATGPSCVWAFGVATGCAIAACLRAWLPPCPLELAVCWVSRASQHARSKSTNRRCAQGCPHTAARFSSPSSSTWPTIVTEATKL